MNTQGGDRFQFILGFLIGHFGTRIDCENVAGNIILWELQHGQTMALNNVRLRGIDAVRRARAEGLRLVASESNRRSSPEPDLSELTTQVVDLMNRAGLSPYEKLLIYQRFWEHLQVKQIAEAQGRRRERVAEEFQVIMTKLRKAIGGQ